MRTLEIRQVPPDDRDLRALIGRLDRELLQLYPAQGIFGVDFSNPKVREMTFCVAYANGAPAGCGGLRPLDKNSAELKRFFVEKDFRGKGIAGMMLQFLEGKAREQGFMVVKLETGPKQPEAIGLYRKYGYKEIEAYGEYVGCEHSYCMEKVL